MGVKISNLPAIVTPALSDIFPVVQSGVTYKESGTQLSSLFATSGANSNITSLDGLTGYIQAPLGIKDASGNIIFGFSPTALAQDYVTIVNQIAGLNPGFISAGISTDVGLGFQTKGIGNFTFLSQNTTNPIIIYNGTSGQHVTNLLFANTSASRNVTFPDADGTIYLSNKANGTEAANAVTASGTSGVITTSSLTTAAGASYAITWTNTFITATSIILLSLMGGTNTKDTLQIKATAGVGTSTLTITNNNAAALDGTVLIGYMVIP